jgi:putative serine protease PepD
MTTDAHTGPLRTVGRHEWPAGSHELTGGRHETPGPQRSRALLWLRSRFGFIVGAAALALFSGLAGALSVVELRPATPTVSAPPPTQPAAAPAAATVEQAAAKAIPSVVKLETAIGDQTEEGSGVVLSADGFILTNNHVVAAPDPRQTGMAVQTAATFADGRSAPFAIVGADTSTDIAVVRVQGISGLRPITMGTSAGLHVGQNVIAIGAPLGLDGTVTTGVISALHRPVSGIVGPGSGNAVLDAIQTDATMSPGSSGGALIDTSGALIGLNSAIATMNATHPGGPTGWIGVGFAIPIDEAKVVADQLIAASAAPNTSLGHR